MLITRQIRLARRQFYRRLARRPRVRRILIHIGAHKTGTTYIQHTMEANRAQLPLGFETVPRRHPDLHRLTAICASSQTDEAAQNAHAILRQHACRIGQRFNRVENLLITHEGLTGPLPGQPKFQGLYPKAHLLLPPIIEGLQDSDAEVSVIFYKRRFRDWQASLYRYRHRDHPERRYNQARFAERTGLPGSWDDFLDRLKAALPDIAVHVFSYEKDRATGFLGTALFRQLGLTDGQIAKMNRLPPKNVSRDSMQHDYQFDP